MTALCAGSGAEFVPGAAGVRTNLYLPREVHQRAQRELPATCSWSALFRRALVEAISAARAHRDTGHELGDDPAGCVECRRFVEGDWP